MSQLFTKNRNQGKHSSSHTSEIHAISSSNQRHQTPKKPGTNSSQDFEFKQTPIDKTVIRKKSHKKKQQISSQQKLQSQLALPSSGSKPNKLHNSLMQLTNRYKLLGKIGQGGFGFIYKAQKLDSGCSVAIKFERKHGQTQTTNRLEVEAHLLKLLTETKEYGFPRFIEFKQMKEFSYLVMELLGLNLEQLHKFSPHQRFSLKTVCMIGIEMLERLKAVHNNQYLYRDVKPENVVVGDQMDFRNLYLIDLGLAKSYKNVQGKHIEEIQRKGLVGTQRYASINSHEGKELSRRDDLESLSYMLIYLYRGTLPWVNVINQDKRKKREEIKQLKINTPIPQICQGMPIEFERFLTYSRNLKFKERPSYDYLGKLLKNILRHNNEKFDFHFDWELLYHDKLGYKRLLTQEKKLTSDSPITPIIQLN